MESNNINYKILIVDDREENIYALHELLLAQDREFFFATNGNDALKIALKEKLSLILMDVQMPGLDGFETAELLKSHHRTSSVPIIFVTAISKEKKYIIKGLEEGAVDYLFKPIDPDVTKAKVSSFLKLYQQQKELEEKNIALANLNAEKNHFLGIASHDLRTPLGHIKMFSDLILSDSSGLTDNNLKYLKIIKNASESLLTLVNNLLDVAKIESGTINLNLENVDLKSLIEQNLVVNRALAGKKEIEIAFNPERSELFTFIDQKQVEQVLNNLLTNAIKFSGKGTRIDVGFVVKDKLVEVSVKDQGQGIPEVEMEKLFKPFQKISVKSTAGEDSTGLGLAIVKKIIELHQGKIWVNSAVGQGSTFSFSLPYMQS